MEPSTSQQFQSQTKSQTPFTFQEIPAPLVVGTPSRQRFYSSEMFSKQLEAYEEKGDRSHYRVFMLDVLDHLEHHSPILKTVFDKTLSLMSQVYEALEFEMAQSWSNIDEDKLTDQVYIRKKNLFCSNYLLEDPEMDKEDFTFSNREILQVTSRLVTPTQFFQFLIDFVIGDIKKHYLYKTIQLKRPTRYGKHYIEGNYHIVRCHCQIGDKVYKGYGVSEDKKIAEAVAQRDVVARLFYSVKGYITVPEIVYYLKKLQYPICQLSKTDQDYIAQQSMFWSAMVNFYHDVDEILTSDNIVTSMELDQAAHDSWHFMTGFYTSDDHFTFYLNEKLEIVPVETNRQISIRKKVYSTFRDLRTKYVDYQFGLGPQSRDEDEHSPEIVPHGGRLSSTRGV